MSVENAARSLAFLKQALSRLQEAVAVPADQPLAVDGTIQRFEFTFELFWKTLQRFLALEGLQATSPRQYLREAYRLGWIDDEARWLKLLEDRNLTSHTYREDIAERVYADIQDGMPTLARDFLRLEKWFAAYQSSDDT